MAITVQDLMAKEILQEDSDNNEMVQMLDFIRNNGVPLTADQAKAMFILKQNGIDDLSNFVFNVRQSMTPTKKFYEIVNKLTLADRIKGNAKLSGILKANLNPSNASTNIKMDGR